MRYWRYLRFTVVAFVAIVARVSASSIELLLLCLTRAQCWPLNGFCTWRHGAFRGGTLGGRIIQFVRLIFSIFSYYRPFLVVGQFSFSFQYFPFSISSLPVVGFLLLRPNFEFFCLCVLHGLCCLVYMCCVGGAADLHVSCKRDSVINAKILQAGRGICCKIEGFSATGGHFD